jgi:hypothetical protein
MDSRYKVGDTVTGINGDYICHGQVMSISKVDDEVYGPTYEYNVWVLDTDPAQTRIFFEKELKDYR